MSVAFTLRPGRTRFVRGSGNRISGTSPPAGVPGVAGVGSARFWLPWNRQSVSCRTERWGIFSNWRKYADGCPELASGGDQGDRFDAARQVRDRSDEDVDQRTVRRERLQHGAHAE